MVLALYYFLDNVKDYKQVAPLVLSLYLFSLWTNGRFSANAWTWFLFNFTLWTNRWDLSTTPGPGPSILAKD